MGASRSDGAPGREAVSRRLALQDAIGFPVRVFAGVAAVLYTVVWASTTFASRHEEYPIQVPLVFRGARVLEGWVRFDGGWYREIANNGYSFQDVHTQSPVAFFPGYPLTMRWLGLLTGDVLLAGIAITFVCGLGVAVLFYQWCRNELGEPAARAAVVTLLVFPYAWYLFGAVYADAFFIVFVLGAFVLVQRDQTLLAGLCAAVATSARPVGVGVVIGLVAVTLERRGAIRFPVVERIRAHGWRPSRRPSRDEDAHAGSPERPEAADAVTPARPRRILGVEVALGQLRPRDAGLLLAPAGLVAWCLYLWRTYGSPFLFAEIEGAAGWDQTQGPRTWFKITWMQHIKHIPEYVNNAVLHNANDTPHAWNQLTYTLGIVFQALLVLGALLLVPRVLRRLGWGYATFVLGVMVLPLIGSKDFQGTGRYLLAVFPVFAVVGEWLADDEHVGRARLRRVVWVASFAVLLLLTSAYARGYYVA